MEKMYAIAGILGVILIVYLIVALLKPEIFQ